MGEEVQVMPCSDGHVFHPPCLAPWLENNNSCPSCRCACAVACPLCNTLAGTQQQRKASAMGPEDASVQACSTVYGTTAVPLLTPPPVLPAPHPAPAPCPCRHELETDDQAYERKKEKDKEEEEERRGAANANSHSEFLYI